MCNGGARASFKIDPGWRTFFFYHHEMLPNKVDGMITRPRLSRIELTTIEMLRETILLILSAFMNKSFVTGLRFRVNDTSKFKCLSIYKGQFKMFKLKTVFHIKTSLNHIIGDDWCLKLRFTDLTTLIINSTCVHTWKCYNDSLGDIQNTFEGKMLPCYTDLWGLDLHRS